MPPQNTQTPPAAPGQFDFMMKDQPKPPGRLGSILSGVPKPAKIAMVVISLIFILVILYSVFFGGKLTNSDQLINNMAEAQEIARVSELVTRQTKDADALSLATTANLSIASGEQQLKDYLKTQKVKVNPKMLLTKVNKDTDKQLETALQNNNYEQTYYNYLKTKLAGYQESLNTSYKTAGPKAKTVLSETYQSVQTLLSAPQLK